MYKCKSVILRQLRVTEDTLVYRVYAQCCTRSTIATIYGCEANMKVQGVSCLDYPSSGLTALI